VSEEPPPAITIAIEIDDPALADRLASLLGGVAGLALAAPGQRADVAIVPRERQGNEKGNEKANGETPDIELTPRELDVLVLMAEGASNKAIARQLGISVHTAKFHVGSILDKLDATGRTDAVAHAARRGVINL
jgi:DNA-binding CsgD family transcriptional regulator